MRLITRMRLLAALLLLPAPSLLAQTAVDPSGHWEGTVQAPNMDVKIEVDLTNSKGELAGTFVGVLTADGKSMSGDVTLGGHAVPFSLTRTGDARIAPAPQSPPIGKELEGTWNGTLDVGGRQQRLVLRMANQPDGTATGTIVSLDGSGVEIPIAMTQKGSSLTVDVTSVGVSFVGVLNAAGTELVGSWTQGPSALPLTFRLAK